MEQKVTVLTPNGRRQNIKVTPNTTILQILEEACKKHGFDSDNYYLTHHNREIGLTQVFRFSGLPNNCLLEMAELPPEKRRVPEKVEICVQLEDGTRKLGQFESSDNCWNVIENLGGEAISNYENLVLLYMRQELYGKKKLSETTLKSLGILEGRALFRILNKNPEELKTQASVYIPPTVKESNSDNKTSDSREATKRSAASGGGSAGGFAITKELVKSLKPKTDVTVATAMEEEDETANKKDEKAPEEESKPKYDWGSGTGHSMVKKDETVDENQDKLAEADMEVEPEMIIIGERNAILYSLNTIQRDIEELPDSFYDLTVNDLKLVLRDLKRIASGNEDAPLLTEKLRELEHNKTMLNKIAHYKNCIIRIQFPDRHVLQGVFKPSDTVQHIVDFVRKFLLNPEKAFTLFTIPPKTILPLDKNLLELDLIPTAVVHFAGDGETKASEEGGTTSVLKPEFLTQLTSIEGALYAANKLRLMHRSKSTEEQQNIDDIDDDRPGPSTGAIPKRPRSDN